MRRARPYAAIWLAATATLALTACDKPDAQGGGGAKGTSALAPPIAIATTSSGSPKRSDGYWEIQAVGASGAPMGKQYLCVGANSEEKFSILDQLSILGDCDKKDIKRAGAGWVFETRCTMMDKVTTQKGTVSGNFKTTFRVDQTVTQTPSFEMKGSLLGRNTGPCPAKFKPGDLVNEDGEMSVNML